MINFEKYGIKPYGPCPTPKQMDFYRRGKTAFIHFTVNTFTNREWGDGTESESVFNPTDLNVESWISTLKEAGFTVAILTAKHHDGFCLWPSKYTEHSIKKSPYKNGQGDIVREFTDACHKYGMKAGIYLSPWDRNYKDWGTEKYNDYYANQLTELMTEYGDIYECWWDGAGSTEAVYDWKRWVDIIRTNQKDCILFGSLGATDYVDVRWIGNEVGRANDPCYGTIDKSSLVKEVPPELNCGKEDGDSFIPAECNTSIRPGWFYHEEQDKLVMTPAELTEYWFNSTGKNTGILLNLPPTRTGNFHPTDCENLIKWQDNLDELLKENLLEKASVTSEGAIDDLKKENVLSLNEDEFYAMPKSNARIEFTFDEPTTFNVFKIDEVIEMGHRVREFKLNAYIDGKWETIITKNCIGFCYATHFEPVTATKVCIEFTKCADIPLIRFIGLYSARESLFKDDLKTGKELMDLAKLSTAKIFFEGKDLKVELGGIFPYNTVILDAEGCDNYEIYSFNGSQYELAYHGFNGTKEDVCRFEDVTGSYAFKIVVHEGKLKEDHKIQIYNM